MKIGVLVNDVKAEKPTYSTTALVRAARRHAHHVYVIGVDDFVYEAGHISAWAREAPDAGGSPSEFLEQLTTVAPLCRVTVDDLDILLLRNNPSDELPHRPWAAQAGLVFGEEAQRRGVLVLNDPQGLSHALSKLYLERFPAEMRPASLVTRHAEDVRAFSKQYGKVVAKPLSGSGGRGVFVLRAEDADNFNQIVEAVSSFGYLIVQEYLPKAREGDVRLLLLNGRPLEKDGRIAALRRVSGGGDLRNNVAAGGRVEPVEVDETMLSLAELARPRLIEDGMFLVGLDVVGDKVMEVNVFSPGGLVGTSALYGVDYPSLIIDDLERKVGHAVRDRFDNRLLACL
jgi:glutathione synthase